MPQAVTKVAGIDPDTKLIVVSIEDRFVTCEAKERNAENRFPTLIRQFESLVTRLALEATWVYIERPPMGVNPRATIDQAKVIGAMEVLLMQNGLPFSEVDPGTWKKGLIGSGRADKPLIKSWAVANLGLPDDLRQDYYDAACIRRWGELSAA